MLATFDIVVDGGEVLNQADRTLANGAMEEKQACAPALGRTVRFLEPLERS